MPIQRFFGDFDLSLEKIRLTHKERINQLRNVLRLKPGNSVILVDGGGKEAVAKITDLQKNFVEFQIIQIKENDLEPQRQVILYASILKRNNFEWVVQKTTEVGVVKIVPLITERTVKLNLRLARLQKIAEEAAEQSGRAKVPEIQSPVEFREALLASRGTNLFFDASGKPFSKTIKLLPTSVSVWIGPEGGWSDVEKKLARQAGFSFVNLSKLSFRAETAAVIAVYLAISFR